MEHQWHYNLADMNQRAWRKTWLAAMLSMKNLIWTTLGLNIHHCN